METKEKTKKPKKIYTEEEKQKMKERLDEGRKKAKAERDRIKEANGGFLPFPEQNKKSSIITKINKIDTLSKNLSGMEEQLSSLSEFIKNISIKEKDNKEPIKLEADKPLEIQKEIEIIHEESQPIPDYIEQIKLQLDQPKPGFSTSKFIHNITSLKVDNNLRSIYKGANIRNNDNPYKNKYKK
jgi:hypothetical protein